jgi:invasion protein IalB
MNLRTNSRIALSCFSLLLLCICATARGEEAAGVHFEHGDWEVACDNTLTCRIAGYCAGEGGGSVLITRAAGPNAPLAGKATVATISNERLSPPVLTLRIDGKPKGKLKLEEVQGVYPLTQAQIQALLAAARRDGTVEFVGDAESFTLSGKGISAVLLKADEMQGRIGTPGALIRKGDNLEESVFPPRPVPVIRVAKVSNAPDRALTAPEVATLKPLLMQNAKGQCNLLDEPESTAEADFFLIPLDEQHVLISTLCNRGAYDQTSVFWVMDKALKNPPKSVMITGGGYYKGEISDSYKIRGWGDCWGKESMVWDGQAFRLSELRTTGMCRGIHAGGTWDLPLFVADVRNENELPRVPD